MSKIIFKFKKKCVFLNVTGQKNGNMHVQIKHFSQRLGEVFLGGVEPVTPRNWDEAFRLLKKQIDQAESKKQIVIFIDELPWMATKRSKLLETIEYYWNQYWAFDSRIKFVVCGSSASWIIDKIVNNKAGLHNRMTEEIHLEPFNLKDTKLFLKKHKVKLKNKQVTEIYMATGGVPYYLSKVEPGMSATQIIEKLAFSSKALLLGEFDNLFSSLFENHEAYVEMIRMLAKHPEGLGQKDLIKKLKNTSKGKGPLQRLKSLEEAGFIVGFTPHFNRSKGLYYRVIDEYCLFYLTWLEPIKRTQMSKALEPGYWQYLKQMPAWHSWAGHAFEGVCYKHIRQIRSALGLPIISIPNTWRFLPKKGSALQGAQIDLLFDRPDDSITICEIKYTQKPFAIEKSYAKNLQAKKDVFRSRTKTQKQIFIAFISANGIRQGIYADELVSQCVSLDDLFE